jgi:hypothetical protein
MEYVFSSLWFWLGVIALVAIIGGFITSALYGRNETKRKIAEAVNGGAYKTFAEEQADVNRRLLERLDAVDARLATIEKTLTDIPG